MHMCVRAHLFISNVNLRRIQAVEKVPLILIFLPSPLTLRVKHVVKITLRLSCSAAVASVGHL